MGCWVSHCRCWAAGHQRTRLMCLVDAPGWLFVSSGVKGRSAQMVIHDQGLQITLWHGSTPGPLAVIG